MNVQERKYKDGFNSGYFLAEHDPVLAKMILNAALSPKEPSEYAYGLANGHDTFVTERIIDQNKEELGDKAAKEVITEKLGDNYQKGFNSGYFLSKHEPELAEKLFAGLDNKSEYYQGMMEGKKEHELEIIQERLNEIAKSKSAKDDKDKDMDKDR